MFVKEELEKVKKKLNEGLNISLSLVVGQRKSVVQNKKATKMKGSQSLNQ